MREGAGGWIYRNSSSFIYTFGESKCLCHICLSEQNKKHYQFALLYHFQWKEKTVMATFYLVTEYLSASALV